MYLVGLTGGIGSGKSTVAEEFAERGCEIVDADAIAREVVAKGEPALDELAARFGTEVVAEDGTLDRSALATIAFADEGARRDLDRITHPRIAARMAERIAQLGTAEDATPDQLVVVDHPLLVETGQATRFDAVVVVLADEQRRVERLVERGLTEQDARSRIRVQTSDARRREVATHVIVNDGPRAELSAAVAEVHRQLLAAARQP